MVSMWHRLADFFFWGSRERKGAKKQRPQQWCFFDFSGWHEKGIKKGAPSVGCLQGDFLSSPDRQPSMKSTEFVSRGWFLTLSTGSWQLLNLFYLVHSFLDFVALADSYFFANEWATRRTTIFEEIYHGPKKIVGFWTSQWRVLGLEQFFEPWFFFRPQKNYKKGVL